MSLKKNILLIHGGPGMDDSYFFPYFDVLKSKYNLYSYTQGSSIEDKSKIK